MADPKRGELVKATKELNELLTPDPLMDTKGKGPDLIIKLNEAACLLEADDSVSDATQKTLAAIGAKLPEGEGWVVTKETAKDEKPKAKGKVKDEKPKAKGKNEAKPKTDAPAKKSSVKKNKFGRREGTKADMMDKLFVKGTTAEKAVAAIVEAFPDKSEGQAKSMIKAHIRDFDKITTGFTLNESKTGIHKAVADE